MNKYFQKFVILKNNSNANKIKLVKKENLPSKICPVCKRPFVWRKKWRLNPEFEGQFKIMLVPNITNICYGRRKRKESNWTATKSRRKERKLREEELQLIKEKEQKELEAKIEEEII